MADLHKTASLTGTGLVAVHVTSLLLDPYAQLRLVDLALPFLGAYRPLWLGLGTLAIDVLVVIVASSLLRHRIGPRVFKALHWPAYGLWPVAFLHALGTGTDAGTWWFRAVAVGCALAVGGALAGAPRSPSPSAASPACPVVNPEGGHPMTIATDIAAPVDTRRLFAAPGPSLAEHLRTFGGLPEHVDLPALVERAGLLGRGGAAFPSARKLRTVAARGHGVVVGNAAEGEPASDKDRTLLMVAPHLVVDGLVLAARAVGARTAYLTTARPDLVRHLRTEVGRRRDRLRIEVVQVEDRFVAGEESALVNAINGRPGVPSAGSPGSGSAASTAARPSCTTWRRSPTWRCSPGSAPTGFDPSGPRRSPARSWPRSAVRSPRPASSRCRTARRWTGCSPRPARRARRPGRARRRLPRGLGPRRRRALDPAHAHLARPPRRVRRRRCRRRAGPGPLRPGRERPRRVVPRRPGRRTVRPLRQRSAADVRRPDPARRRPP